MLLNKHTLCRNNNSIRMNISEIIASHESVQATEKRDSCWAVRKAAGLANTTHQTEVKKQR